MPTLPQYIAQRSAEGAIRQPIPASVDVSGLVRGVNAGLAVQQHQIDVQREREQAEQERQRRQLAHDEAALQVINAESRLQMRATEYIAEAEQSPEGLTGITGRLLKEFDGWAKEEDGQASADAKPILAKTLARMRASVNQTAFGIEMKARQKAVADTFAAGLDDDMRLAFADPSQAVAAMARRQALAETLALPDDTRRDMSRKATEGIASAAAQGMVDRDPAGFLQRVGVAGGKTRDGKMLPSDPAKAAEAVKSDPILSQLDPGRLVALTERATMLKQTADAQREAEAERARARAEAAANKREREANQAFTILSGYLRDGRVVDMTSPDNQKLVAKLAGTPYAAALGTMAQQAPANAAAATLPIPQQEAELSALYTRRNASGTSPALEDEIERREKVLKAAKGDYQRNPITAAVERGVLKQAAPLDLTSIDSIRASLPARSEQAKVAARQAGRPAVSPFDDAEAEAVARQLSTLSWQDFGARVAELAAGMTPMQAQAFAAQINQKDRGLALALAAGTSMTSEGRTVAALVRRGQETVRDKGIKEDAGAEFGLRAQISKHLGDALGGQAKDDVIDAARLIYLGKAGAGEDTDVPNAVRLALGGTLAEHNGRTIPVAAGVDDLAKRLREYPLYDLSRQTKGGAALINGRPVPVEALWRALPGMQLEPVSVGRYTVRTGGHAVLTPERTPIVIEVR